MKGPLVRRLFETYASGRYSLRDLKELSHGWGLVSRSKKPLVKAVLERTLTRPFYYGLMKYNGEHHEGTHDPLISKELFHQVQAVLKNRGRPRKPRPTLFPFLGLAMCESCGCSITAERQKGHIYYRCTKKREKCAEPYVREEMLAEQVQHAIQNVALPEKSFQKMLAQVAKERDRGSQPVAKLKTSAAAERSYILAKLDRLLETHLEGLVEVAEYQSKKESLLKRKIEIDEQLAKVEQRATGWLEPCADFLKAAHQTGELQAGGDLESQKDFLKKIGSNFRLSAKTRRTRRT